MIIEKKTFVCSDAENNNNKFWQYEKHDNNVVHIEYGRVGGHVTKITKNMTDRELAVVVNKKMKGKSGGTDQYKEIEIVGSSSTVKEGKQTIATIVSNELAKGDTVLESLIKKLALANSHELNLISGGQMSLNSTTGLVTTPLGIITKNNVEEARLLLDKMVSYVDLKSFDSKDYKGMLSEYLKLVPQKVGHRNWHLNFMVDHNDLQKQGNLLDQLSSSFDTFLSQGVKTQDIALPTGVFETEIQVLDENSQEFADICKFFNEGRSSQHISNSLKPVRVYKLNVPSMKKDYDEDGAKLINKWRLWHGTRIHNVLSILKNKLIVPKNGGSIAITGRMFGDGIYFSDKSTKSLNYSHGYWSGNYNDNCFMFLADVGMGKYYNPSSSLQQIPKGYDSCYAMGGKSSVLHNEMIVYRTSQCNLTHLVEFDKK